jgi:cytochrome c oxidase cbb3-type subunit 2
MKGLAPLFLGLFGTFAFSWIGLTVIPNIQIGALNPQSDEEGTDIYPVPKSGMAQQGRLVYVANGCIYCHSQQVRPDYAAADIDRKWGVRRSAPRDYLFDRPVLLGQQRLGPDLANVGKRGAAEEEKSARAPGPSAAAASPAAAQSPSLNGPAQSPAVAAQASAPNAAPSPSATPNANGLPPLYSEAWHHRHLYSPRSMSPDSIDSSMPAYKFLYRKQPIEGERAAEALQLTGSDAPPLGWQVVPTYDAKCLVAYLMSLDQTHPLKEVKSVAAAQPAGSPAAGAAAPPPAAPAKK